MSAIDNNDAPSMEKMALTTVWVDEAKQIPLSDLSLEEIAVLKKCIDKEGDWSDDELSLLKKTLQRYRPALQKIKPKEVIDNVEKVNKIIQTEQALLDILDNSPQLITVHLPIKDEVYDLTFKIKPFSDSKAIDNLQLHVDLFRDFSIEEKELIKRQQEKNPNFTPEEKILLQDLQNKIAANESKNYLDMIIDLLSNQLELVDSTATLEEKRKFWEKIPFNIKMSLFMKVQDLLGLGDINDEDLFQFH